MRRKGAPNQEGLPWQQLLGWKAAPTPWGENRARGGCVGSII